MRSRLATVFLLLLPLTGRIMAQNTPEASVVLLMDLSYSLRIAEYGVSRQVLLNRAVRRLLTDAPNVEWSVLSFDDIGSVRLEQPFTVNTGRVERSLGGLQLGRLSPIGEAVGWAAGFLVQNANSKRRMVVLVSDGVSTDGARFSSSIGAGVLQAGVTLHILGVEHLQNPQLKEIAAALARSTGGDYFTYRETEALHSRISGSSGPALSSPVLVADASGFVPILQTGPIETGQSGPGLLIILLVLGSVGALAYLALAGVRSLRIRLHEKKIHRHTTTDLVIEFADSGSDPEEHIFQASPVQFGNRRDADVKLSGPRAHFTLAWARGDVVLTASRPVLVNGVATSEQMLHLGDRITFGPHRVVYRRLKRRVVVEGPELTLGPDPLPLLVVSLVLVVMSGIMGLVRTSMASAAEIAAAERVLDSVPGITVTEIHTAEPLPPPVQPDHETGRSRRSRGRRAQTREAPDVDPAASPPPGSSDQVGLPSPDILTPAGPTTDVAAASTSPVSASPPASTSVASGSRPDGTGDAAAITTETPETVPGTGLAETESAETQAAPEQQERSRAVTAAQETAGAVIAKLAEPMMRFLPLEPPPDSFLPFAETVSLPVKLPLVITPGSALPETGVDILFVHAHPDDESLDFAGLMCRASRAGLKTAVVIVTDGESGLDRYPDRPVGGLYFDSEMSGADLSLVRAAEAVAALGVLSCDYYIRLGLPNHPYNNNLDVLSVEEVAERWGGRDAVSNRLREIIQTLRPTIVISSDSNPQAYEHFEHRAVGWLVRELLLGSESAAVSSVEGYLVSVDHFQRPDLYETLFLVDVMRPDPQTGLSYREIQMAALKQHHTQGDASLIGVEMLPNFGTEQYRPVFWDLPVPLEEWLLAVEAAKGNS